MFIRVTFPSKFHSDLELECQSYDSIKTIKGKIEQETGFPPTGYKLWFGWQPLIHDSKTLADHNIQKDSILSAYVVTKSLQVDKQPN